jgi:predicted permease
MQGFYDLKVSLQRLYQNYEYSLVVTLILSLTLSIALFLFSIVYAIQFKPLPDVESPESLVWGTLITSGRPYAIGGLSNYNYEYLRQRQTSMENFGRIEQRSVTLSHDQFTEQLRGAAVTSSMFRMLGINPLRGRLLLASDDAFGATKSVVISYQVWDTLFNKSENIFEQSIKLDGEIANIVGIMPKSFRYPINHDVWFADPIGGVGGSDHGGWNSVFGRLKPNVKIADVDYELKRLMSEMIKEYPDQYKGKDIDAITFTKRFSENQAFLLTILKIASLAILLMGCFSVCNLIIVRNLENAKEVLIKTALGVPVVRIVVGMLLETFWLSFFSSVIGIWFCFLGLNFFGDNLLAGPYWWTLEFQAPVLITGIGTAFFIWLATGIAPVWMASRQPTNGLLSSGRKGGAGASLNRVMAGMSTLQIFSAFILMVFTGVLIGAFLRMANADYGVPRDGYLIAEVKLSGEKYAELEQRNQYYKRFVEQAERLSGVEGAAVINALPGTGGYLSTYSSAERNIEISGGYPKSNETPINDTYFNVMEIKLIEGRNFTADDIEGAEEVAIINQSMANILFPGESALGRQFQYDPEKEKQLITIVGVVPDVVSYDPLWYFSDASKDWRSQLYRPIAQKQPEWNPNTLIFKTTGSPYDLVDEIKAIARDIDSGIPLYKIKSYDDFLAEAESGLRRLIFIFAPAALLGLIISALGIYSIARRVVLQSTPDIGVMRSLGIEEQFINRQYLSASTVQLAIGLFAGVAFSGVVLPTLPDSILITSLGSILSVCGVVAVVVFLVVLFASYIPLLKAHKMSPREAMNFMSVRSD